MGRDSGNGKDGNQRACIGHYELRIHRICSNQDDRLAMIHFQMFATYAQNTHTYTKVVCYIDKASTYNEREIEKKVEFRMKFAIR